MRQVWHARPCPERARHGTHPARPAVVGTRAARDARAARRAGHAMPSHARGTPGPARPAVRQTRHAGPVATPVSGAVAHLSPQSGPANMKSVDSKPGAAGGRRRQGGKSVKSKDKAPCGSHS